MTRILHVLDHSLPLHSGYTFRTRAILKSLRAAGMEVRGITGARHSRGGPAMEQVEGLTFHRVGDIPSGPPGLREWREIESLRKGIERVAADWRPDILHAHSPALCGMAGLRAARRLDLPFVYEIRAFWEDAAVGNGTGREGSLKYRLTRSLENRVVAGADAVYDAAFRRAGIAHRLHHLPGAARRRGRHPARLPKMPLEHPRGLRAGGDHPVRPM